METLKEFYFYVKLPKDSLNGATLENASVNPRTYYYLKLFSDFKNNLKAKTKWNWFAAFFGMQWLAYRKMYKYATLFYVLFIVSSIVPYILIRTFFNNISKEGRLNITLLGVYLASFFIMGFYGNRLYFNSICSKIERNIPPPQKTVSILAIIMVYILSFMVEVGIEVISRILARS